MVPASIYIRFCQGLWLFCPLVHLMLSDPLVNQLKTLPPLPWVTIIRYNYCKVLKDHGQDSKPGSLDLNSTTLPLSYLSFSLFVHFFICNIFFLFFFPFSPFYHLYFFISFFLQALSLISGTLRLYPEWYNPEEQLSQLVIILNDDIPFATCMWNPLIMWTIRDIPFGGDRTCRSWNSGNWR